MAFTKWLSRRKICRDLINLQFHFPLTWTLKLSICSVIQIRCITYWWLSYFAYCITYQTWTHEIQLRIKILQFDPVSKLNYDHFSETEPLQYDWTNIIREKVEEIKAALTAKENASELIRTLKQHFKDSNWKDKMVVAFLWDDIIHPVH